MKKLLLFALLAAVLSACRPAQQTTQQAFQLPEVEDIAMYQVNPRVFAPEKSLLQ
jgi:uncharacterized lipoprotein YmbA